jgi:chorismate synthase
LGVNSFGERFCVTTFGESHGEAIGCIIDGVPAGIKIDKDFIQSELDRRKPGKNEFTTKRNEADLVQILSGVFQGVSTGTPIGMVIYNTNQKSKDYSSIKDLFRPGHADFTYFKKYGTRDYRGGGRSSARETALRVASGAVAKLLLKEFNIEVKSGIYAIGNIEAESIDFDYAKKSEIYSLDKNIENIQKELIKKVKKNQDSIGGVVLTKAFGVPVGFGEPMYYKLDSAIGGMFMGLNAVKAVEIGDGIEASKSVGSKNNDNITKDGFVSNHSGGVLGGISNGNEIVVKTYFKPTPSIFKTQKTVDIYNNEFEFNLEGRHDPCVAIRGSIVCESMLSLILADMLLLNLSSNIENIKKIIL